jgi:hypothetical protein
MSRYYYLQSCYDGAVFEWCADDTRIKQSPSWMGLSHRQVLERVMLDRVVTGSSELPIKYYLGDQYNWLGFDRFLASHEQGPLPGIKIQGAVSNFSFGLEITLGMEEIYGRACQFHNTQLLARGNDPLMIVVGALDPARQAPYLQTRGGAVRSTDPEWAMIISAVDQRIVSRYAWSLDP